LPKVSLRWLKESDDEIAKVFRNIIGGSKECALCCMFLETEWTDENNVISKCTFDEIDESELEHFQQMAEFYVGSYIEIVSLEYLPHETQGGREIVKFD
jgi:hypothetical protein